MDKLIPEKIKLKSGKEIEISPLPLMERMKLFDLAMKKYYNDNIPMSMEVNALLILACTKLKESDLNLWSNTEIVELGNEIWNRANLTEIEKKS